VTNPKGTAFERQVANFLAAELGDDRIDRRARTYPDKGDIGGVRAGPYRVAVECKSVQRFALSEWLLEADAEASADFALVGVVVHKRRGYGQAGQQYVSMTLRDLVALLKVIQR
jgi:hypothetical protein